MKNNLFEGIFLFVFLGILLCLSDPFMIWMPEQMVMVALLLLAIFMGVWSGFVLKEKVDDERESIHRMNAGRIAYFTGIASLTMALLVQGFSHAIDPWITLTLGLMVFSKVIARLYFDRYK